VFGHVIKHTSRLIHRLHKKRKPLLQVPVVDDKRFLFIGGLHRSGTSILHRLLREHPLTSGFNDSGVQEDEGQHLQSVFLTAHSFGGPGEFAFHTKAHLTEKSPLINQHNRDTLLKEWGAYYDLGKQVLLEKSPPNLIRSRFFRQMFPNSAFVFIVRHPVAVALATEKWSDKNITDRLLHWHTAHSIMLDDIRSQTDCLVIRYEDLVKRPQHYLDKICDLVGLDHFTPEEHIEDHNEKYFLQWKQRYVASATDTSGTENLPTLPSGNTVFKHFGYTLNEPFVKDSIY
jgi:hypothetical protein